MIRKNIDVSLGEDGARPIAMLVQLASQYAVSYTHLTLPTKA